MRHKPTCSMYRRGWRGVCSTPKAFISKRLTDLSLYSILTLLLWVGTGTQYYCRPIYWSCCPNTHCILLSLWSELSQPKISTGEFDLAGCPQMYNCVIIIIMIIYYIYIYIIHMFIQIYDYIVFPQKFIRCMPRSPFLTLFTSKVNRVVWIKTRSSLML